MDVLPRVAGSTMAMLKPIHIDQVDRYISAYLQSLKPNTFRVYNRVVNRWIEYLKPLSITEAQPVHVARFFAGRELEMGINPRSRGTKMVSGNTLSTEYGALRGLYAHLLSIGIISISPIVGKLKYSATRNNKRVTEGIPDDKVLDLLMAPSPSTAIGKRDRAILACLLGGALRLSELCNLNIGDVVFSESQSALFLCNTKSGEDVQQDLAPFAFTPLKTYLATRSQNPPSDPLFISYSYGDTRGRISPSTVQRLFKGYCKAVGLPPTLSVHSARASAITRLLDLGLSHREVREFSRHGSVQMVERYDKRRFGKVESIAKKLKW